MEIKKEKYGVTTTLLCIILVWIWSLFVKLSCSYRVCRIFASCRECKCCMFIQLCTLYVQLYAISLMCSTLCCMLSALCRDSTKPVHLKAFGTIVHSDWVVTCMHTHIIHIHTILHIISRSSLHHFENSTIAQCILHNQVLCCFCYLLPLHLPNWEWTISEQPADVPSSPKTDSSLQKQAGCFNCRVVILVAVKLERQ